MPKYRTIAGIRNVESACGKPAYVLTVWWAPNRRTAIRCRACHRHMERAYDWSARMEREYGRAPRHVYIGPDLATFVWEHAGEPARIAIESELGT